MSKRYIYIMCFDMAGMKQRKIIIIISLFILFLTGARLLWFDVFNHPSQSYAVKGQIDLRNQAIQEGQVVTLDGEWLFYPYEWLAEQGKQSVPTKAPTAIQVPKGWSTALKEGDKTPYGYGSYHLKIIVKPEEDMTYSLRIPSIRSASEVYVNHRLLGRAGQLGERASDTVAQNIPYTLSFQTNGQEVIDIIVQVANFQDPRNGGIVRSIQFGKADVVNREVQLSIAMQQLVAVVFLIHAIYAVILYTIGDKDKRLLDFSLLMFSTMLFYLLGSDEKLLSYWLSINYEWGFKGVHLAMLGIGYSLWQCMMKWLPTKIHKWMPYSFVLYGVAAFLTLILPARYVVLIQPVYGTLLGIPMALTMVIMLCKSIKEWREHLFLLLAIVAFINNIAWYGILLVTGTKMIHYPFDLIITMACLATVWFKEYAQVHADTQKLAMKLQKADKLKNEFLANTSHELRNPLHGILNISKAVLEREAHALSTKSVNDLETVLSVGQRMSLMLNDLLDVMHLKENTPTLQLQTFSIHTIIMGVIDILSFMKEGKDIQFILEIPEDFPKVYADENRVIQIVFNLLHNALKFTNEGQIVITGNQQDGRAEFAISDTGIGIDSDTMQRLFEPYEQGELSKAMVEGGFGLGLSISKRLVELHGGILQVESMIGVGSTFRFTLPLSTVMDRLVDSKQPVSSPYEEVAAAKQLKYQPEQAVIDGKRARILVVDDESINLRVVETILPSELYEVVTVTSGMAALDMLHTHTWDLIISDVMMPKMSGYELIRVIRQRFSMIELPVLLLTARNQPMDMDNGFLAGANDYVTKPVNSLELRARVEALTNMKTAVQERLQMEAAWLQAQIEPHFLFNALNAIVTFSEIGDERASKLLEALSDFLRESYKFQNTKDLVPLEDELHLVHSYMYIQQERFGERITFQCHVEVATDVRIPSLTIQPLIENALTHGILKRREGGTIYLHIVNVGGNIEITVTDDGVGMEEEHAAQLLELQTSHAKGIGLLNTNLRLKRLYGQGLHIKSKPNQGTSISFIVMRKK
ncbi:ATP-binding response regulator [Lysinibacillus piscis]|uniref:ATP-binding response regulator n=1 Tax=Lysinibacillus piscis TaxID=2518931 RepID=UPI00222E06A2|nr:ATP-binding protein [Lysinibacillus sp. KH24]